MSDDALSAQPLVMRQLFSHVEFAQKAICLVLVVLFGCATSEKEDAMSSQIAAWAEQTRTSLNLSYDRLIKDGLATEAQREDSLAQHRYFYDNYETLRRSHAGKFVAISNFEVFSGESLLSVETAALSAYPDNQFYVGAIAPAQIVDQSRESTPRTDLAPW